MRRITFPLLLASGIASSIPAQEMLDTTYVLEPLVVTATRAEAARRNVPVSVTVVLEAELRATGATGVLDAIAATTPGVFVTQRGAAGFGLGPGAAGKITIRGIGGAPNSRVLVLVDGRPDFTGLFGHPLPDGYALSEVERVEIIRGPASAIYGTNAMGGVINIITKRRARQGDALTLRSEAGPWRTLNSDAVLLGAHAPVDYRFAIGYTRTDGHRPDSDFKRAHFSGAVGLRNGRWDLRLQASSTPFEGHDPGEETLVTPSVTWIDVVRNDASARLSYHAGRATGSAMLYRGWGTHVFSDGWHSHDYVMGVSGYGQYSRVNGAVFTVGFDAKRYGGDAVNDTTGVNYGSHAVNEFAPSFTAQLPLAHYGTLTGSILVQHHSTYGWFIAPEGGASFHLTPKLSLRGSVSRGFRSPDMRALYLFPASRDTLKPETVLNTETGLSWRMNEWMVGEVSLFRITGEDLIAPPPPAFANAGSFVHYGVETELRWALPRVHGRLFAAWQEVGDEPGSADMTISATTTMFIRRARLMLGGQWVRGLHGTYGETLPSYAVLNATVTYPIGHFLEVDLALRNLLNTSYQTMTGYPMPGFYAMIGLNARIER